MIVPPTWISKRKAFTHRTTDSFTRLVRRIDCHIFVKPKIVPGVLDSTSLTYALPLSTYGILSGRASLAMLDLLRDADIELKSATDCVSRLLCRHAKRWGVLAAKTLEFNRPGCHAIAVAQDSADTYGPKRRRVSPLQEVSAVIGQYDVWMPDPSPARVVLPPLGCLYE